MGFPQFGHMLWSVSEEVLSNIAEGSRELDSREIDMGVAGGAEVCVAGVAAGVAVGVRCEGVLDSEEG